MNIYLIYIYIYKYIFVLPPPPTKLAKLHIVPLIISFKISSAAYLPPLSLLSHT